MSEFVCVRECVCVCVRECVCVCVSVCVQRTVLWKHCSYWSGLSVTNEPSGTVTGMRANYIKCVCVCGGGPHACPQVVYTFVCVCVCVSMCVCVCQWYLVWPVGLRRLQAGDSTGLCCAPANLLNCEARGGQGEASSSQGARSCNLKCTPWRCALLLLFLHQCGAELRWCDPRKPVLLFSYFLYATLDNGVGKS